MKTHEIMVGKAYTNGKGGVRLIIAAGPEYMFYDGQADKDCVRFRVLERGRGTHVVGAEQNNTRNSFAKWATIEIDLKALGMDDQGRSTL